jgi:peptidoglycan/LPS O-acetylase OafA/YrhL
LTTRIKGLDGIRALAILLVFLGHETALGERFGAAEFGVHLFFVLSGFLIIGALHAQRREIEGGRSTFAKEWCDFNLRRAFRILPPYLGVVLAAAFLFHLNRWLVLRFVTYTENFDIAFRSFEFPMEGSHFWSLCVEAQFYILAAPLFLLIACNQMRKACGAAFLLAVLYTIVLWYAGFPLRSIYVGPGNLTMMALGGMVALTPRSRQGSALAGAVALPLYLTISADSSWLSSDAWFLVSGLVVAPAVGAVVIGSIAANPASVLTRILDCAPIRGLGRISYMFYLVQPFVHVGTLWPNLPAVAQVLLDLAVTVAISAASWSLFEARLIAFGRSLVSRRLAPEPAAPPRLQYGQGGAAE